MARKKTNLSKIKDFFYGPPVNVVKRGFMTFDVVNICVQIKFKNLQELQNCHACQNLLFYSKYVRKHVFYS